MEGPRTTAPFEGAFCVANTSLAVHSRCVEAIPTTPKPDAHSDAACSHAGFQTLPAEKAVFSGPLHARSHSSSVHRRPPTFWQRSAARLRETPINGGFAGIIWEKVLVDGIRSERDLKQCRLQRRVPTFVSWSASGHEASFRNSDPPFLITGAQNRGGPGARLGGSLVFRGLKHRFAPATRSSIPPSPSPGVLWGQSLHAHASVRRSAGGLSLRPMSTHRRMTWRSADVKAPVNRPIDNRGPSFG